MIELSGNQLKIIYKNVLKMNVKDHMGNVNCLIWNENVTPVTNFNITSSCIAN